MNLLALETSSRYLSVALWRDGNISERAEDIPNGGSESLLPWVAALLEEAGMVISGLDAIAFGAGPGGFTGLRLACGVAQGLAFGLDLPVLGVSTLAALALASHAGGAEEIFACIDARMNEVYCGAYRLRDGTLETVMPEMVVSPQQVTVPAGGGWIGCGDGFITYPDLLAADLMAVRSAARPTAAAVARLAAPRLANGEGTDAGSAYPWYVRDKVALTTVERIARGGLK